MLFFQVALTILLIWFVVGVIGLAYGSHHRITAFCLAVFSVAILALARVEW
jgi:hypothetical protein